MLIHLSEPTLSFVLDFPEDRLPAVLHWGDPIDDDDLQALQFAAMPAREFGPVMHRDANGEPTADKVDFPHPGTPLFPTREHLWFGEQGLVGHFDDGSWNPKFHLASLDQSHDGVSACYEASGLRLTIIAHLVAGPLVELRSELTNTSNQNFKLQALTMLAPLPREAEELLDFGGRWTHERTPLRTPLNEGTRTRRSWKGRPGHDSAYLMAAGPRGFDFAHGDIRAVHVAWSGNSTYVAQQVPEGFKVLGGGEALLPGEGTLHPSDTHRSPALLLARGEGLDSISHAFHRHVRSLPNHPQRPRPVNYNVWEAVYLDQDRDTIFELAELAASVGAERFVLDDGWFQGRNDFGVHLGDWTVDPMTWPDGLEPLIQHVKSLDMEFGLWFEPEMVSDISELAQAHPEWIQSARAESPQERIFDRALNLAIPECRRHIHDAMHSLLAKHDIAYVKWDHNRDLIDSTDFVTGKACASAHTQGFLLLIDQLREEFPDVEFESCAGGGGRIDLATMSRMVRTWPSDNIDALDRAEINRWTAQLLPLEYMGTHVGASPDLSTSRALHLHFRGAMAVLGHMGIEWDLRKASQDELDELRRWVSFHKSHRELIATGNLMRRCTEEWDLTGVVAPDQATALYRFATLTSSQAPTHGAVPLPGLDPLRRYEVRAVLPGGMPDMLAPRWMAETPGSIVLSGKALAARGMEMPRMRVASALFLELRAL